MQKDQIITLQGIIDFFNTNLKKKIEGQITWNLESPPPFQQADPKIFRSGKVLINFEDVVSANTLIRADKFIKSLILYFIEWSMVRYTNITVYSSAGYNNGGPAPTRKDEYKGYTHFSFIRDQHVSNIHNDEKEFSNMFKETLIDINKMEQINQRLYALWLKYAEEFTSLNNTSVWNCHVNCHGNCHGSGGRR